MNNRNISKKKNYNGQNKFRNLTKKRKYTTGGGVFSEIYDFFEHPYKMFKFERFVSNFNKTKDALHSEYASFEAETELYKGAADKKVKHITDWLTASKVHVITTNFLKNKKDLDPILKRKFENLVKISKEQKATLELKIKSLEKDVKSNKGEFQRMNKKFNKNITKFEKMIEKYRKQADYKQRIETLGETYATLSKKDKANLSKMHKEKMKRFEKHKADYQKINQFTDSYIERTSQFVKDYTELRRDAEFYNKIFYEKNTGSKDGDLKNWSSVISTFYDNLEDALTEGNGYLKKFKEVQTKLKNVGFRLRSVDSSKKIKELAEIMDLVKLCIEHQENINDLIMKLRINFSNNQPAIRMHYDPQLIFTKMIYIRKQLDLIDQKMKKL